MEQWNFVSSSFIIFFIVSSIVYLVLRVLRDFVWVSQHFPCCAVEQQYDRKAVTSK